MRVCRAPTVLLLAGVAGCGGGGGEGPSAPSTPAPLPTPGGACAVQVLMPANEGWGHVPEGTTVAYASNPPASGPHYDTWARYQAFATPVARGHWVHNLEHGAIVLLYRSDAPDAIQQGLRDAYASLPADPQCGHTRALLTPDAQLARPFAVVAADHVLVGDCVDAAAVRQFVQARRGRGPEGVCTPGTRP